MRWLVFAGLVALTIWVVAYTRHELARSRRWRRWADDLRSQGPTGWIEQPLSVLAHVTADGEVIDYPVIPGEIAALPEVAA